MVWKVKHEFTLLRNTLHNQVLRPSTQTGSLTKSSKLSPKPKRGASQIRFKTNRIQTSKTYKLPWHFQAIRMSKFFMLLKKLQRQSQNSHVEARTRRKELVLIIYISSIRVLPQHRSALLGFQRETLPYNKRWRVDNFQFPATIVWTKTNKCVIQNKSMKPFLIRAEISLSNSLANTW